MLCYSIDFDRYYRKNQEKSKTELFNQIEVMTSKYCVSV